MSTAHATLPSPKQTEENDNKWLNVEAAMNG